jgi:hypothetical protein
VNNLVLIQNGEVVKKGWEIGELVTDLGKEEKKDGKRS